MSLKIGNTLYSIKVGWISGEAYFQVRKIWVVSMRRMEGRQKLATNLNLNLVPSFSAEAPPVPLIGEFNPIRESINRPLESHPAASKLTVRL